MSDYLINSYMKVVSHSESCPTLSLLTLYPPDMASERRSAQYPSLSRLMLPLSRCRNGDGGAVAGGECLLQRASVLGSVLPVRLHAEPPAVELL